VIGNDADVTEPQLLKPIADIFPLFVPKVTDIAFVLLVPVLPFGRLHAYAVAPVMPFTVYVPTVALQGLAFPLTIPEPVGAVLMAIAFAVPEVVPQEFTADTFTFPMADPKLTVIDELPCPLATDAPVGTVQ